MGNSKMISRVQLIDHGPNQVEFWFVKKLVDMYKWTILIFNINNYKIINN